MAERPDDPRLPSALGIALAGLGSKDEAVAAAKRGVAMYPVSKEAWVGAYRQEGVFSSWDREHPFSHVSIDCSDSVLAQPFMSPATTTLP